MKKNKMLKNNAAKRTHEINYRELKLNVVNSRLKRSAQQHQRSLEYANYCQLQS